MNPIEKTKELLNIINNNMDKRLLKLYNQSINKLYTNKPLNQYTLHSKKGHKFAKTFWQKNCFEAI